MFTKTTTIMLLLGLIKAESFPNNIQRGRCPHAPGDLISKAKDFKPAKLDGVWYSAWDDKKGTDELTCMATKFGYKIEEDGTHETLEWSLSNALGKGALKDVMDEGVDVNYYTHEGRFLMFDQKDPTVAT